MVASLRHYSVSNLRSFVLSFLVDGPHSFSVCVSHLFRSSALLKTVEEARQFMMKVTTQHYFSLVCLLAEELSPPQCGFLKFSPNRSPSTNFRVHALITSACGVYNTLFLHAIRGWYTNHHNNAFRTATNVLTVTATH